MALLHTEVSEAVEAWRKFGTADAIYTESDGGQHGSKPEGIGSEFADILIRLLGTAMRWDIDLEAEFRRKMDYNHTLPYRHNKRI